ncbi:magnesium and cobalt transport protein CorA [uncultured Pseudokineococcus sp.]|uniref:magnesium and cobalt transport protein CorA n=1 Tax=uncultured Pseudokineococcus sp. TaxID=1642928 RepID=UPI00262C861B|nr:magnesium and cobalt transport protein CorA [uncultured Pseudokineococcus sp.]
MSTTLRTCDSTRLDDLAPAGPGDAPAEAAAALARAREAGRGFVWVHLDDPREGDLHGYREPLGLHPLAVEDLETGRQRPKLEVDAGEGRGSLLVSARTTSYDDSRSAVETGEVLVVLGDRWVLTVSRGDDGVVDRARRRLGAEALGMGAVAVLHAVLDVVVDGYVAIAAELEEDVSQLEREVFSPDSPDTGTTSRVYELKREVLELLRAARPLVEPARRLWQTDLDLVPEAARVFLRDVSDHAVQAAESAESTARQLGDVHSAHLAEVGLQQNDDARRISAWAALAAVPTLVAGVYGMNFALMPELQWRYGYPVALLVMLTICLVLHRAFKRSGWL